MRDPLEGRGGGSTEEAASAGAAPPSDSADPLTPRRSSMRRWS